MATTTLAVPKFPASSSSEFQEQNADVLPSVRCIDEELDPLKVALSGYPDVNSYRAHYEGARNEAN